jgi:hypothetical protein
MRPLRIADEGEAPQVWMVAAKILNKKLGTAEKECVSRIGVGLEANNPVP